MESSRKYLNPEVLARLEGLSLRARSIVEGYVAGMHRSPYHGFSIEFAEHREYVPGDDLRYLDWKVFGRTDKYYLKQFEEETNLVCYLALDTSQSMGYQGPAASTSKLDYAKAMAATLAYLVLRQQDSVGLATFDSKLRSFTRASSSPAQLKPLLHELHQCPGQGKTDTAAVCHELAERLKKRGIVIIVSDLFDDVPAVVKGLEHLRHRRHEVIVFHVLDPAELEFPFRDATRFRGLEQLPSVVAEPRALRQAYLAQFGEYLRRLQRGCRRHRVDYVPARTDHPLELVLSSYLASRTRK